MFSVSRTSLPDKTGVQQNCVVVHVESSDSKFHDEVGSMLLQAVELAYPEREVTSGGPNFVIVPHGYDVGRFQNFEELVEDLVKDMEGNHHG